MAEPTCGDCFYRIDGLCSDGGYWFDFSDRPHAGQPRSPNAPVCAHYRARDLPAYFHVGGINPRAIDHRADDATLADLLFSEVDAETVRETIDADPFTLDQLSTIRALLTKAAQNTRAPKAAIDAAVKRIQDAANNARFWLKADYQHRVRRYQVMTELSRVGKRRRLTKKPNPHLINALLYGALAAGVLNFDPDEVLGYDLLAYPAKGLDLLHTLTADNLCRAVAAARDEHGMLHGESGRPESTAVRGYISAVVREYSILSGKPGAPFGRNESGHPCGPLIELLDLCLAPVAPMRREGIADHLKILWKA